MFRETTIYKAMFRCCHVRIPVETPHFVSKGISPTEQQRGLAGPGGEYFIQSFYETYLAHSGNADARRFFRIAGGTNECVFFGASPLPPPPGKKKEKNNGHLGLTLGTQIQMGVSFVGNPAKMASVFLLLVSLTPPAIKGIP